MTWTFPYIPVWAHPLIEQLEKMFTLCSDYQKTHVTIGWRKCKQDKHLWHFEEMSLRFNGTSLYVNWSVLPIIHLSTGQCWFRKKTGSAPKTLQVITWANIDLIYWSAYTLLHLQFTTLPFITTPRRACDVLDMTLTFILELPLQY